MASLEPPKPHYCDLFVKGLCLDVNKAFNGTGSAGETGVSDEIESKETGVAAGEPEETVGVED